MPRIVTSLFAATAAVWALAGAAGAATIPVTRFDDPNPVICLSIDCSFREAVIKANADAGPDTVQLAAGIYTLTLDQLPTTNESLTIQGAGASLTTITGSDTVATASPAGAVIATTGGTLTIRGVTMSGNRLTGTADVGAGAIAAAGAGATVVIESSAFRNNRSEAVSTSFGSGAVAGGFAAGLTITDSAIEDNVYAGSGGASVAAGVVWGSASSGVTISRSSVSRNRVDLVSGPAVVVGGVFLNSAASLTITDSTVSANSASSGGTTFGRVGGVATSNVDTTALTNATITDNVTGGTASLAAPTGNLVLLGAGTKAAANTIVAGGVPNNCTTSGPAIASSGGNLEDTNTCSFTAPGDRVSTDPLLGALRNNGGVGRTQAPLPSSPVFGLARPELCSASDQRGVARPVGGACDSGAFEGTPPPVNTALPSVAGTAAAGQALTCSPGSWSGAPTFAFRWLRDGAAVSGATSTSYSLVAADLGTAVQCQVTATNVAGEAVATSAAVSPPLVVLPANTVRPSIAGTLRTGRTATCATGTWTGTPTFAVSWLRTGIAISGAAGPAYLLRPADAGRAIQCRITATGSGGAVIAESIPVVPARACIVPSLRGLALPAARLRIARAGCGIGAIRTRSSSGKAGRVLSFSPAQGRNLPAGSKIGLTISRS